MRIVANSIPKSGTHLLDRLLLVLGFDQIDFGGIRPHPVGSERFPATKKRARAILGLRSPENVMGIGSHLVYGGRFAGAQGLLRTRGKEKVAVGVDFPRHLNRRWLKRRLGKVPDGGFVTAHCIYTPELASLFGEEGMKTVCILRDPRDVAVSQMRYIEERKQHFAHKAFTALPSDRERLLVSIRGGELGGRRLLSLDERYRRFSGWSEDPQTVVIRFEELVGAKGGGSAETQGETVERVASHLGLRTDEQRVREVQEVLFGEGKTFRKGQIGGWREEFSAEHERAIKEGAVGPLLVELGYEEAGPNW